MRTATLTPSTPSHSNFLWVPRPLLSLLFSLSPPTHTYLTKHTFWHDSAATAATRVVRRRAKASFIVVVEVEECGMALQEREGRGKGMEREGKGEERERAMEREEMRKSVTSDRKERGDSLPSPHSPILVPSPFPCPSHIQEDAGGRWWREEGRRATVDHALSLNTQSHTHTHAQRAGEWGGVWDWREGVQAGRETQHAERCFHSRRPSGKQWFGSFAATTEMRRERDSERREAARASTATKRRERREEGGSVERKRRCWCQPERDHHGGHREMPRCHLSLAARCAWKHSADTDEVGFVKPRQRDCMAAQPGDMTMVGGKGLKVCGNG